jgi:hypothetical protein
MDKNPLHFRIRTALEQDTECPLCVIEDELERRYIQHYFSELVMDPPSRRELVESRGFCNCHLHRMLKEATEPETLAGTGMALVMRSVVEALIQDLKTQQDYVERSIQTEEGRLAARMVSFVESVRSRLAHPLGQGGFLTREARRTLPNVGRCPICLYGSAFTQTYVGEFVEFLASGGTECRRRFEESKGLCIPHFVAVINATEKRLGAKGHKTGYKTIKLIVEVERRSLGQLNSEFTEYLRKQDYRFSEEPWGSERDVVTRGVTKLVGRLGLATPRANELTETPLSTVTEANRTGEYEERRTEVAYLTARNKELTRHLLQLGSECAGLRFRDHELFEDNKTLVIRLSGLRAENMSFRKMLEKHGLIQPIAMEEAKQEDQRFRDEYLFFHEEH